MTGNSNSKLNKSIQKVLAGKRISIPESLAKKWAIHEGDIVIVQEDNRGIRIIPADAVERSPAQ